VESQSPRSTTNSGIGVDTTPVVTAMPLKICCHETSMTNINLRNIPEEQRLKVMCFFLYEAVFLYIVSQDTSAHKHEERHGT